MISQYGAHLQRRQQILLEQKLRLEELRLEYLEKKDAINETFNKRILAHTQQLNLEILHELR